MAERRTLLSLGRRGSSKNKSSSVDSEGSPSDSPPQLERKLSSQTSAEGGEADGSPTVTKKPPKLASLPRKKDQSHLLFNPKNVQVLMEILQRPETNPNSRDEFLDAPLHSLVKSTRKDKLDLIVALLTHSEADVNLKAAEGMTALHFAVQVADVPCAKALIAFGANVNAVNLRHQSPLDLATIAWVAQERGRGKYNEANNKGGSHRAGGSKGSPKATRNGSSDTSTKDSPKATRGLEAAPNGSLKHTETSANGSTKTMRNGVSETTPNGSPSITRSTRRTSTRNASISSWVFVDDVPTSSATCPIFEEFDVDEGPRDFWDPVNIRLSDALDEGFEVVKHKIAAINDPEMAVKRDEMLNLLYKVGAEGAKSNMHKFVTVPKLVSITDSYERSLEKSLESELERSIKLVEYNEGRAPLTLSEELQDTINLKFESHASLSGNPDEAIAIAMQQRELSRYKKTKKENQVRGGSRILFLDGGGMKGLLQIEVLRQIEEATGRRITELFDWIVGTSTGGILALTLVYTDKTLLELRKVFFRMKDEVFGHPRAGFAYSTRSLERLLQEELGTKLAMDSVKYPKVLVAAVSKKTAPPQLHFFNNCFDDEYNKQLVWKVARYTSAGPMFFKECDNYVDGGVLANNPCDYGLTAIQNYYRQQGEQLPIALVVSVGSGVYPAEEMGRVDVHEFLFFGKHWFNFTDTLKKRTHALVKLLSGALLESEMVAENCETRCNEQGIPFYRFSPHLDEVIPAGETDNEKLIDMIIAARIQTIPQGLPELVRLFHMVAAASRKLKLRRSLVKKKASAFLLHQ